MEENSRQGLLAGKVPPPGNDSILYHDTTARSRALQKLFVSTVILMVVITLSLSIYRGVVLGRYGGLYFMLGVCLIGLVAVQILLVAFIHYGDVPKSKLWFLYFIGMCIMLEAIFTNVLLFKD